jgi:hypothetical protein
MDEAASGGREARFAAYVEALGRVIGHADRQEPMRDYCLGLLMPIARNSVAPLAAVMAPAPVAASTSPCFILLAMRQGRMRRCWPRSGSWCGRPSSTADRLRPGSLTTQPVPRRGGTRSG